MRGDECCRVYLELPRRFGGDIASGTHFRDPAWLPEQESADFPRISGGEGHDLFQQRS
jgi:hypothetical protein